MCCFFIMDFLSNNSLLPAILCHLPSREIQMCRKVNRRFYYIVDKYSRTLAKPRVIISINREKDLLVIQCDDYSECIPNFMFLVTLGPDSVFYNGTRGKQFMDSLNWNSAGENQLLRLREVLSVIFSKVYVAKLDLETENRTRSKNGQQLTGEDFACIAHCLSISKAKVGYLHMARLSTLRTHFMPKPEWKTLEICLGQVPMRIEDILQIPNNFEKLKLHTQNDRKIPGIAGIRTIIEEWVQGIRNFRSLSIFRYFNKIQWYSLATFEDMLYEFPNFVKIEEKYSFIKGRIRRSIDQKQLFLYFDHRNNVFELSIDPKNLFMISDM